MNYLRYFKIVENKKLVSDQITKFEVELGCNLPIILKVFYLTYDTSDINKESLLCYFSDQYDTKIQFYHSEYLHNTHISINRLYSPSEILSIRKLIYHEAEKEILDGYIPVGECNDQGVLLVGISAENCDKVFIEYAHTEERLKFVCNNIFEFFQDYQIIPLESDLPFGIKLNRLYQKWGEDFWRISNNESE